ncbi:YraN family protein [Sinomonas notoginsengisoli]|uniref:YraN family protein n=1 Tax=Sinomonas notoginsengisoli TaxID=1457311 RepID=UPI001F17359D|nr:YraN family protein [Sinomonas notoginsengisoli]
MRAKDRLGQRGERLAEEYLRATGAVILDRNWRGSGGELDIVAADAGALVAVEVKARRSWDYGHPFEAVDACKLGRIIRLLGAWAEGHGVRSDARRIDVVAVTGPAGAQSVLEHLKGVA